MMRNILAILVVSLFVIECKEQDGASENEKALGNEVIEKVMTYHDGVDFLIVVDNSGSMGEEQEILADGLFSLLNPLINPTADWPFPEADSVRIAVVSSDLGLQWGDEGSTEGFPYTVEVQTCTDAPPKGDDGAFQTEVPGTVTIASGQIPCDEDGSQCPADFVCSDGFCVSPTGEEWVVNCKSAVQEYPAEGAGAAASPSDFILNAACMTQLGTQGCGVEQQLEAPIRALSRPDQADFLVDSHYLSVIIVSDENDCSIQDPGLFATAEWMSGTAVDEDDPTSGLLNTACNLPSPNDSQFLFPTPRFWEKLVELKDNMAAAVTFTAIVGVPGGEGSPCEGRGNELDQCLSQEEMQLEVSVFESSDGNQYKHFAPACTRVENGEIVTEGRPGRRFVEVAESFGSRGYVHSICNSDWSRVMEETAKMISENFVPECLPEKLGWAPSEDAALAADGLGVSVCDAFVAYQTDPDVPAQCPFEVEDVDEIVTEDVSDDTGTIVYTMIYCPLPKLPAELDCSLANSRYAESDAIGWYYCENQVSENFEEACMDSIDNDGDGLADCEDAECASCLACGGQGEGCQSTCKAEFGLTEEGRRFVRGQIVAVACD